MHRTLDDFPEEAVVREIVEREARHFGRRVSAEEYYQLEDDGCRYELIDGVVCMSPSPNWKHQNVLLEIALQLAIYLKKHPVGAVLPEIDVRLGTGPRGGDIIYRPDVVFLKSGRLPKGAEIIEIPPDLVVEVASVSTRRYDLETKKADYERMGISEYWIVDPRRETMTFFRLKAGSYVEVEPDGDRFASVAVPGFALDLSEIRRSFRRG